VEKNLLHGCGVRPCFCGHFADVVENGLQPCREAEVTGHDDGSTGHIEQARAIDVDDAEARAPQAGVDAQDAHQWRKWRVPVNTMGMPRSLAAAITSSSRMLPPG